MTSCHLVLGAAGLLLAIGLVMVFSASSIEAALAHEPVWAPGVQQVVWAALGVVAMLVALRLPAGRLRRLVAGRADRRRLRAAARGARARASACGSTAPGSGSTSGRCSLQPSEVAKLVFALWGAHLLALRERLPDHAARCWCRVAAGLRAAVRCC